MSEVQHYRDLTAVERLEVFEEVTSALRNALLAARQRCDLRREDRLVAALALVVFAAREFGDQTDTSTDFVLSEAVHALNA
ncbi:hypothetical protein PY650_19265 [Rhizobium calliandrae]|uniref:Uncharacterized protein n=1 Tax=Rhizobium calliandrae TaxID=1312182 RepID=A0ABT7KGK8_9HYPH|nr:hypothetical protein [Rhizobium calliandrae]MDL2407760.1 hypothetical protein [Rhizobium calliandrae]